MQKLPRTLLCTLLGFFILDCFVASKVSAAIEKFVDPLPLLPRIKFEGPGPFEITMKLSQFEMKMHRDLAPVPVWGYNGSSPGPILEIERGKKLRVFWLNALPQKHIFPSPKGADVVNPDVRAVTHLHGAVVSEPEPLNRQKNNDGWPDAWNIAGQEQVAEYPNQQSARMLWYHDHAMGSTGRNVAAGLYGGYEIHDDYERSLNLPSGKFEVPLILHSKQLNADGTLSYTNDISNEFYGNATTINGMFYPFIDVEPRKYRFRILNASNARTYAMKLLDEKDNSSGPAFFQIGSDGGFLPQAAVFNDPAKPTALRLTLAPAERADVIIDFSPYAGRSFTLSNNSKDPGDIEASVTDIMLFKVGTSVSAPDKSVLPSRLAPIPRLALSASSETRKIIFDQMTMPNGAQMLTLNGKRWTDPIEEKPALGATEIWELVNPLTDTHPFHIHQIQFQVVDRTLFDVPNYLATGKVTLTGTPVAPANNEMGWKDTVRVLPQMVTRIIMRFAPFPGFYVYHCHILEHEDMDMMRPFQIVDSPQSDRR